MLDCALLAPRAGQIKVRARVGSQPHRSQWPEPVPGSRRCAVGYDIINVSKFPRFSYAILALVSKTIYYHGQAAPPTQSDMLQGKAGHIDSGEVSCSMNRGRSHATEAGAFSKLGHWPRASTHARAVPDSQGLGAPLELPACLAGPCYEAELGPLRPNCKLGPLAPGALGPQRPKMVAKT